MLNSPETNASNNPNTLPRRAILNAAWAAPVVVIAAASPAMAASPVAEDISMSFVPAPPESLAVLVTSPLGRANPGLYVTLQGELEPDAWFTIILAPLDSNGQATIAFPEFWRDISTRIRAYMNVAGIDRYSPALPYPPV